MKRTVWKFTLALQPEQDVFMPRGAVIRHVGVQHMAYCVWAEVDPNATLRPVRFCIVGTGYTEVDEGFVFAGTIIDGSYVWHVYTVPLA